jgi:hypothetical protein
MLMNELELIICPPRFSAALLYAVCAIAFQNYIKKGRQNLEDLFDLYFAH